MATNLTNTSTLLSVSEYLKLADQRTVARLVSDTGEAVTAGSLTSDANLAKALLAATGEIEAACLVGGRYSPTDLAGLTGAAQAYLHTLVADITTIRLYRRRPDLEVPEKLAKEISEKLKALSIGVAVFGTQEAVDAGVINSPKMTEDKVRERAEVSLTAARLFGRRAAWNEQSE